MAEEQSTKSEAQAPSTRDQRPGSAAKNGKNKNKNNKKNALLVLLPVFLVLAAGLGYLFRASGPLEEATLPLDLDDGGVDRATSRGATGTASLNVEVLDTTGAPIAGARLALSIRPAARPGEAPRQSTTDARGRGRFDALPRGEGTLLVHSEGHARGHVHVALE
ncbi:MAG: hypothetical protein DRJ42_14425, partial [Deltaproteobacteria bacterium]